MTTFPKAGIAGITVGSALFGPILIVTIERILKRAIETPEDTDWRPRLKQKEIELHKVQKPKNDSVDDNTLSIHSQDSE
jgi:hypothetical protein